MGFIGLLIQIWWTKPIISATKPSNDEYDKMMSDALMS